MSTDTDSSRNEKNSCRPISAAREISRKNKKGLPLIRSHKKKGINNKAERILFCRELSTTAPFS
jgi:hypothetical protein